MALGLETGAYMVGVLLVLLVVLPKNVAKLAREKRSINSPQDIIRETHIFFFKSQCIN